MYGRKGEKKFTRMDVQDTMANFNKYKKKVIFVGSILMCLVIYILVSRFSGIKPVINKLTPSAVMRNCYFNIDNSIMIMGENFNNIVGIYINGVWEPRCDIIDASDNCLLIRLPNFYYISDGELEIQIQTKINSIFSVKSNKKEFKIFSDDDIETPKIDVVLPKILSFGENSVQQVTLQGENLTENSIVTVNDKEMKTFYNGDSLTISVPYSDWYQEHVLKIQVIQFFDGYPTSVKSQPLYLDIKD